MFSTNVSSPLCFLHQVPTELTFEIFPQAPGADTLSDKDFLAKFKPKTVDEGEDFPCGWPGPPCADPGGITHKIKKTHTRKIEKPHNSVDKGEDLRAGSWVFVREFWRYHHTHKKTAYMKMNVSFIGLFCKRDL